MWGPDPIRLGFIGAPIATAISFNLISLCSVIYGVWYVPRTAWHPLSRRCFTSLGVLVQLGLAGVGQTASEWWSWELIGRKYRVLSGGSGCGLLTVMCSGCEHAWSDCAGDAVGAACVGVYHVPSSVRAERGYVRAVSIEAVWHGCSVSDCAVQYW